MIEHDPRQITIDEWLHQLDAQVTDFDPSKLSPRPSPTLSEYKEKDWRTRQDSNL